MYKARNQTRNLPWRRRRRKLLAALGMLCLVMILLGAAFRLYLRHSAEQELEAIRAEGYPATPEELKTWYSAPPPGQNAAEIYTKSFEAQHDSNTGLTYKDIADQLREAQSSIEESLLREMEAYLAENAEALRLLHEAAQYPAARYPLDFSEGFKVPLPHLAKLRGGVRMLNLEALVAAARGRPEDALDSLMTALAAIESIREEPIIISQLIGVATRENTCETVQRLLGMGVFSEEQLAQLSPALRDAQNPDGLRRALAGERVFGLDGYSEPQQLFEQFANLDQYVSGANTIVSGIANATGALSGDRSFYLEVMDTMIEASQYPYYQSRPVLERLEQSIEENESWMPRFSQGLLPALTRMHATSARSQASVENAVTAIAIERYRNVTGQIPQSLSDLMPSFLESVPLDPFTGDLLRYKPSANGYAVYSVGENLRDDGAAPLNPNQSWLRDGDWIFQVSRN